MPIFRLKTTQLQTNDDETVNFKFRSVFAYFDEKRCRWETEKNSCDDDVADTDGTLSDDTDSGIDSEGDGEDASDTDTSVAGEISSDDVTDVTDTIDAHTTQSNTENLQCEPLDQSWMCSSGSRNLSLCVKFCTVGLDLSHVLSLNVIENNFTVKIQKRWPN